MIHFASRSITRAHEAVTFLTCSLFFVSAFAQAPLENQLPDELVYQVVKEGTKLSLNWKEVEGAKRYRVQLSKNPDFSDAVTIDSSLANASTTIAENEFVNSFYWRVQVLDESNEPISDWFSNVDPVNPKERTSSLRAPTWKPKPSPTPSPTATPVAQAPAPSKAKRHKLFLGGRHHNRWVTLGTGFNYVNYHQSLPARANLNYQDVRLPSFVLEGGHVFANQYGAMASLKSTPGDVTFENFAIDKNAYQWKILSLEGFRDFAAPFDVPARIAGVELPVSVGVRAGLQYHMVPFVHFTADNKARLKENSMTTLSVGPQADLRRREWGLHWYMRYQHPLTSSALDGADFSVDPKFAFDGSVGASYYFKRTQWKLGAYWYGQWHFYDFQYSDSGTSNSGSQSLFYSNMDLRLGYEF